MSIEDFVFVSMIILAIIIIIFYAIVLMEVHEVYPSWFSKIKVHKYPSWIGIKVDDNDLTEYYIVMDVGLFRTQYVVDKALTSIEARDILKKEIEKMIVEAEKQNKQLIVVENHYFAKEYCVESLYNIYVVDKEYFT